MTCVIYETLLSYLRQQVKPPVRKRYTVPAIDRALDALAALAQHKEGMTLAQLVEQTGIPKSTLYRIMSTLEERRCVVRDEHQKTYQLGVKLWEFGNAFLNQSDLQNTAADHMKELAEACGESIFLGMLDRGEVVYIRRVESPKSAVVVRKLGQRAPVHCTATGLAMLSFLPDDELQVILEEQELRSFNANTTTSREQLRHKVEAIRRTGVAVVDGEYNAALLCVSSPILDREGRPAAALTAALLSTQGTDEQIDAVKEKVKQAALNLSTELGYLGRDFQESGLALSPSTM